MAIFYPPLNQASNFSQKLTEGELYFLNFLAYLDDTYEIFYQSYVNGLRPDITIIKKNHGILLIEIKDWNLSLYKIDPKGNWFLKENDAKLKSPEKQVMKVKNALFDLYIPNLLEKKIHDSRLYKIISCAVYFHTNSCIKLKPHNKYISFLYKNNLIEKEFDNILKRYMMFCTSPMSLFFSDDIYEECIRIFNPPIHLLEEGSVFAYTPKQQAIIDSANNNRSLKIKGFAGGGKTTLLAQLAMNAYKRTSRRVLILTFNITLRNYIRDRISRIRENFPWRDFEINHYHIFISNFTRSDDSFSPESGFEIFDKPLQCNITDKDKFNTILIDEIQDYKKTWLENIKKFLLDPNQGLIVFGDEKQNIYDREMIGGDQQKKVPYTGISGQWNFLNENHRLSSEIGRLVKLFQTRLSDKYEILDIIMSQNELSFDTSNVQYHYFSENNHLVIEDIVSLANTFIKKYQIHDGDVCFLSESIATIRKINVLYTNTYNKKTSTTFEDEETFELLKKKYCLNIPISLDEEVEPINNNLILELKKSIVEMDKSKVLDYICQKIMHETKRYSVNFCDIKAIYQQLINNNSKNKVIEDTKKNMDLFEKEINSIRRSKKINFQPKNGLLKLSTIHSFKGWEIDTLFLIISNKNKTKTSEELIYTAMTRARTNLIICNLGNTDLDAFFYKQIQNKA